MHRKNLREKPKDKRCKPNDHSIIRFATAVNDTGGKFAVGVNDAGGNLPPVSRTPAANNGNNIRLQTP
jgi:hypothetical protein